MEVQIWLLMPVMPAMARCQKLLKEESNHLKTHMSLVMEILNTVLIHDSTLIVAEEAVISPHHVGPSSRLEVFRGFLPQPWIFWFL